MNKPQLREWARNERARLPVKALSEEMAQRLAEFLQSRGLEHVLLYSAFGDEPDPTLLQTLYPTRYYLTRTSAEGLTVHALPCPLERHPFGFLEPAPEVPAVSPDVLEAVVVPGLCFDREGFRLGYGKGYYDRFLAALEPGVLTIGFVPEALIVEKLPLDSWDVPVRFIAAETGVRAVREPA